MHVSANIAEHPMQFNQILRPLKFAELLEQNFGTPFHMISKQAGISILDDEFGTAGPVLPDTLDLDDAFRTGQPCTQTLSADQAALVIPQRMGGIEIAFVGVIPACDAGLAVPLANALTLNFDQQQRIDSYLGTLDEYAGQVTNDFEELTWLRSLAELAERWEPQSELAEVGKAILSPLCERLRCEAIFLFGSDLKTGADSLLFSTPNSPVSACSVLKVVTQFGDQAKLQPVVRNSASINSYLDGLDKIRNCVLVPVASVSMRFGWLVMVNKLNDGQPTDMAIDIHNSMECLWEFGTFEAGLLQSASASLAAHASNLESFRQIEELLIGVIRAMINSIDAKDAYTCGHSDRVAAMARLLATQMGLSKREQHHVYMAGLLHDIGKIGVPDSVLSKPSRLTDEEFTLVKQHPEIGFSILSHLKQLHFVLPGVLHHHEAYDGSGYPHGLAGEAIPLLGRILAVADTYDALTSCRPYRNGMQRENAEAILRKGAGQQWDAKIVDVLLQSSDMFHNICQMNRDHTQTLFDHRMSDNDDSLDEIGAAVQYFELQRI